MGQFLSTSHVLMRFKAFCLTPLRVHLQAVKLPSGSIDFTPQQQGAPSSLLQPPGPFCFSDFLWGRADIFGHTSFHCLCEQYTA